MSTTEPPGWSWNGKRDVYQGLPKKDRERPIPLGELSDWLLNPDSHLRIQQHLNRYFTIYKGRFFEILREKSSPRRFGILDVSAAETLSVVVPPQAVNWLTSTDKERDALLDEICDVLVPGKDDLRTCDLRLLTGDQKRPEAGGALFHLYYLFRKNKIGPVTTSKLLAVKFPKVVPILDSRVSALLKLRQHGDWWLTVRSLLIDPNYDVSTTISGFALPTSAENVSLLRRLDIILWMEAHARQIRPMGKNDGNPSVRNRYSN